MQDTAPPAPPLDRNLALELVRATEAAAIRAYPYVGRGDKNGADGAAVDAMRAFLSTVDFDGLVVIGEGEKDRAPMLFNGEHVGRGTGPACDVAVDPIDGTALVATGRQNALSVIAVSDRGSMLDAAEFFYMNKIVTGSIGRGVVDLRQPIGENIRRLAKAIDKSVSDIRVAVLDRPRHRELIEDIRSAGASTRLLLDGDVAGGINAVRSTSRVDMCVGIGGSAEGVTTACAVKALGGHMQAALIDNAETGTAGQATGTVLELDDLVRSDNTLFVATGVTDGELVSGVRRRGGSVLTESIVLRSRSGTFRRVLGEHRLDRWL